MTCKLQTMLRVPEWVTHSVARRRWNFRWDSAPVSRLSACRYIQNNKLTSLAGLAQVPALTTLHAAGNALASLDGVQHCAGLNTLQAGSNSLSGPDAITAVTGCTALMTLDLQDNQIADAAALLRLLEVPITHIKCTVMQPCQNTLEAQYTAFDMYLLVHCRLSVWLSC